VSETHVVLDDASNGYEGCAEAFMRARNPGIGALVILEWAATLPPGGAVLDVGCGSGVPVTQLLLNARRAVYGVDASPTLVAAFQRRFPRVPVVCAALEDSDFFARTFAGVVAIGLVFLLAPESQRALIRRVADVLEVGGRFLFTAPREASQWPDALTRRESVSLGRQEYEQVLREAGLVLESERFDEGCNHYYSCVKRG
jgi:cyclopropane fatty-acyl-phospholipid synthase-like methyltransferase